MFRRTSTFSLRYGARNTGLRLTIYVWQLIIATRNRLVHAYLGIDEDTVWSIVRDDIHELLNG